MPAVPIDLRDAIDGMARRITFYCMTALDNYERIQCIMDQSETAGEGLDLLVQSVILPSGDYAQLKTVRDDVPRLQLCLERMQDIKSLARKVFEVNHSGSVAQGSVYVFNQEVVDAELAIAMKTPIYVDDEEPCRERKTTLNMPSTVRDAAKITSGVDNNSIAKEKQTKITRDKRVSESDLICKEEMISMSFTQTSVVSFPRQTRQSRPPQPARSCQRSATTLCKGQASMLLPPPPK